MSTSPAPVTITPDQTVTLCQRGQDEKTCRFLGLNEHGFQCCKGSDMHAYLNGRALNGQLKARGDNCTGPPDFQPLE